MSYNDYYDYADRAEQEEYVPDQFFLEAKDEIRKFFSDDKGGVFYMRQLQVLFEKQYFHWITANAVSSLLKEGFLKQHNIKVEIPDEVSLELHFFCHKSNRYPIRKANSTAGVVTEFSRNHITSSCGNRAEVLFAEALSTRGLTISSKKANEYKGKKWLKTEHDLDYIFEGNGVVYGCEIKNTLSYIDKNELDIKLKMCSFLGLRPLFIMRASPKSYNYEIFKAGGFAMIFVAQIYDLSQRALVEKIKDTIGIEVDCPKAIPMGIIDRFEKWHKKQINS